MPQIFAGLSISNLLLLLLTGAMGLYGDTVLSADRHVLLAVITLVLSCFVQVVVFTYFTVTGKIVSQAVHLGRLDADAMKSVDVLKRSVTRCVGLVMAAIVVTTATGAVHWRTEQWAKLHLGCALALATITTLVLYRQFGLVLNNAALLNQTLDEYGKRPRTESRVRGDATHGTPSSTQ